MDGAGYGNSGGTCKKHKMHHTKCGHQLAEHQDASRYHLVRWSQLMSRMWSCSIKTILIPRAVIMHARQDNLSCASCTCVRCSVHLTIKLSNSSCSMMCGLSAISTLRRHVAVLEWMPLISRCRHLLEDVANGLQTSDVHHSSARSLHPITGGRYCLINATSAALCWSSDSGS